MTRLLLEGAEELLEAAEELPNLAKVARLPLALGILLDADTMLAARSAALSGGRWLKLGGGGGL